MVNLWCVSYRNHFQSVIGLALIDNVRCLWTARRRYVLDLFCWTSIDYLRSATKYTRKVTIDNLKLIYNVRQRTIT
jgi:uncharacterized RDD family membrane protein YckC